MAAMYIIGKAAISLIGGDSHLEKILNPGVIENAIAYAAIVAPLYSHCLADVPFKSEVNAAQDEALQAKQVMLQYVTQQIGK